MEFDFSPILENWRYLWGGFGITLGLSGLTVVASLLLGFAMAVGRIYGPRWLRWPLVFYIDSMRAIPVLVVLVWTGSYLLRVISGRMSFIEQRRQYRQAYDAYTDEQLQKRFESLSPAEQELLLRETGQID